MKYVLDELRIEPDSFEDLGATIRLDRRNAHLRHDLYDALDDGLDIAVHRFLIRDVGQQPLVDHVVQGFIGHIRINGLYAIPQQQAEVVHFTGFTGLQYQPTRVRVPARIR